jgi:hypothetical protein
MIGRCVLRSCTPEESRSNPRTDHRFANVRFLAAHSHSRRDWADRMRSSALSLYVTAPDDCPRMIVGVGDNQLLKKARQCLSSAAQRIRRMLSTEKFALICTPEQALGEDVSDCSCRRGPHRLVSRKTAKCSTNPDCIHST